MTVNSQSTGYTCVLADANNIILHPTADTTARTFTIDTNTNTAFAVGTTITFINQHGAGTLTIACNDTMYLSSAGTTGNRSLVTSGMATAVKVATTEWLISGTGLS
jgi:hypothetical protein